MPKLLEEHIVPPGGWRYRVPETGFVVQAWSWAALVPKILAHYQANALKAPAELEELVVAYACGTYAKCEEGGVENHVARGTFKNLHLNEVVRFTRTYWDALKRGEKVSQDEANRRASICATCPYNQQPDGCTGCNSRVLKEIVGLISQAGRTPHDGQLKSCRFCGCFIQSLIWYPLDTLQKFTDATENEALPSHCWKKRL